MGEWINQDQFVPRYNIAPRTQAPVIRLAQAARDSNTNASDSAATSESYVLHTMKWGLVPHWSKTEPSQINTINARSENLIHGGGMWESIKGRKRCVVVAQG